MKTCPLCKKTTDDLHDTLFSGRESWVRDHGETIECKCGYKGKPAEKLDFEVERCPHCKSIEFHSWKHRSGWTILKCAKCTDYSEELS